MRTSLTVGNDGQGDDEQPGLGSGARFDHIIEVHRLADPEDGMN